MTTPFRITGYKPIEDTPAFAEMTLEDARWMARLIAQLSEAQISTALTASGFNAEEVAIYTSRLISRRDQLLRDTRLTDEFPAGLRAQRERVLQVFTR